MRTFLKYKPITLLFVTVWIIIWTLDAIAFTKALTISEWVKDILWNSNGKINDSLSLISYKFIGGEYWRIFTYSLCHFGLLHIIANVSFIWYLGGIIEQRFNHLYVFGIYIFATIFSGCIALYYLHPTDGYMIGSSPGIYALVGFYIVKLLLAKKKITQHLSSRTLLILLLINLLGFDTFMCHLTGFLFGAASGFITRRNL